LKPIFKALLSLFILISTCSFLSTDPIRNSGQALNCYASGDVVNFKKPWPMRPFEITVLGDIELISLQHPTWQIMLDKMEVNDSSNIPKNEINAHMDILKKNDGEDTFLKIMKSFDDS
jgi:hypothetical protein